MWLLLVNPAVPTPENRGWKVSAKDSVVLVVLGPSPSPELCSHGPRWQCNSCARGPRSHLVFSTCILLRNTTWCQKWDVHVERWRLFE